MKINKFKKIGNNKYKIFTLNGDFTLYEDVIIKYNLLSNNDIDLELMGKLLKENEYYEVYNLAVKYIEIKMRSKEEIIKYLSKKDFNNSIIDKVVNKLIDLNLINDISYIKAYVNDKVNLSNDGPLKIKEDLLKNKIEEQYIEEYLNTVPEETWINKIEKIVNKKVKLNKNKSTYNFKKTLFSNLLYLGYSDSLITEVLENIKINDKSIIENEYKKIYKRLSKKYEDEKLIFVIKNELLKKGFTYEEIMELKN